jgi:hypothetical protein
MNDILKICNDLETQMFNKYGDPIVNGRKSQDESERVRFTYYVSKLMEVRGHKWVRPAQISGEHEDRAYYSEKALFEAFEAGMLIAKSDAAKMREQIRLEVKQELMSALEDM